MIPVIFYLIGFLAAGIGYVFVPGNTGYLVGGLANLYVALLGAFDHSLPCVLWNGGIAGLSLYCWWNNGGGDNTKRRLKKWAAKFKPVRRTAPQPA